MLRLNRVGLFPELGLFVVISIASVAVFLMMQTDANKQTIAGLVNFSNPLVLLGLFVVGGCLVFAYFKQRE